MVGMEAVGWRSPGHRGQVGDPHGGGWAPREEGSAGIVTGTLVLEVPPFSPSSLQVESGTDRCAVVKKALSVPTDGGTGGA